MNDEFPKNDKKGKDAFQLFPDLMEGYSGGAKAKKKLHSPPKPPDISWLWKEELESVATVSEIPTTLLLMPEGENRTRVAKAFEEIGYLVETAASEEEAIEKMKFVNLAAVVLQTETLEQSVLHNHMKWLPMAERRKIYYVLIGSDFHTMYDLQALSLSANLIINTRDIDKINILLRKGLQEYEDLFGPFLAALREYGRN